MPPCPHDNLSSHRCTRTCMFTCACSVLALWTV
jgi:hypothetical protein